MLEASVERKIWSFGLRSGNPTSKTTAMPPEIQQFAALTRQFCSWAENPVQQQQPKSEARFALQLISSLYQQGLHLQALPLTEDAETSCIPHEEWKTVFQRFHSLPFAYYMQCARPQNVLDEVPGIANLADDLADIWRDLKEGLVLFDAGHVSAAVWQWQESFWQHWGTHATGAMFALHNWLCEHLYEAS